MTYFNGLQNYYRFFFFNFNLPDEKGRVRELITGVGLLYTCADALPGLNTV